MPAKKTTTARRATTRRTSRATAPGAAPAAGGAAAAVKSNGNGYAALSDISAYPLLTEEISFPSAPSGIGGAGSGDVGVRANAAIRDVLGWRPNPDDSRGFRAALEQSFALGESQGHVTWRYTPRGYAMMADLGAVTGAQASLLNRARAAVDLSKPLIEALVPLVPTAIPADYEPIRSMVVGELDGIVAELAQEGGPRIQKVDDLFRQLLGADIVDPALRTGQASTLDPVELGLVYGLRIQQLIHTGIRVADVVQRHGHLYTLQERMGLNRDEVNTVDDERVLSNFMTAQDSAFSLWIAWWLQRNAFGRVQQSVLPQAEPFLGTQLVLVSRSLAVVAEAVQELNFTLDTVFIGPPERQTIRLDFLDGQPSLYLGELLQWVEDVASTTGPRYIQDAGKDGVIAITDTLRKVLQAVTGTVNLVQTTPPSPAMAAPRVRFALQKLAAQLQEVVDLTDDFSRRTGAEKQFETPPTEVPLPPHGMPANKSQSLR